MHSEMSPISLYVSSHLYHFSFASVDYIYLFGMQNKVPYGLFLACSNTWFLAISTVRAMERNGIVCNVRMLWHADNIPDKSKYNNESCTIYVWHSFFRQEILLCLVVA